MGPTVFRTMPKAAVTVNSRAREFKSENFYVNDGKILMCKYCDCRVEYERKENAELLTMVAF